MDFVHKIVRIIEKEKLVTGAERVLVGLSGGVDSAALLSVLIEISRKTPFTVGVAHVNHQLRDQESERDEDFVRSLSDRLSLSCYVKRADVRGYAKEHSLSLQHAGRDIRYGFFDEIAGKEGYDRIAIAHNLDDQIETFFLRLLKGSGIRGLSSIPMKRGKIIRPFLHVYRHEIEAYAGARGISFVEDSSNSKTTYERNFIRKNLMPVMAGFNPPFREKVFSLLQDLTSVNRFFDDRAEAFLRDECTAEKGESFLELRSLMQLDPETRFRVVSSLLMGLRPGFIPLREHIRLVEKVVTSARSNASALLPFGIRAIKIYTKLCFTTRSPAPLVEGIFPVGEGRSLLDAIRVVLDVEVLDRLPELHLQDPFVAYLDAEKSRNLSVRTFRAGDRFVPLGMGDSVKVKDFFIARKVPREARRQVPLLLSGEEIAWMVGYRIDDRFKVDATTRRVLKVSAQPLT